MRGPSAPRVYDPTPQAGPMPGEFRPKPVGAETPYKPVHGEFYTIWLVEQAGRRVGWSHPRSHAPPRPPPPRQALRPRRRAVRRLAGRRIGWAEARAGQYTSTYAREKENEGQNRQ